MGQLGLLGKPGTPAPLPASCIPHGLPHHPTLRPLPSLPHNLVQHAQLQRSMNSCMPRLSVCASAATAIYGSASQSAEEPRRQYISLYGNGPIEPAALEHALKECQELMQVDQMFQSLRGRCGPAEMVVFINHLASITDMSRLRPAAHFQTHSLLVEMLNHLAPNFPRLGSQQLLAVLWSISRLKFAPDQAWLSAFYRISRGKLKGLVSTQLVLLLRSLTHLEMMFFDIKGTQGFQPWMMAYLQHSYDQLPQYQAQELVKTVEAFAELRFKPPAPWMQRCSQLMAQKLDALDASSLSKVMLALSTMKYEPDQYFLRAYHSRAHGNLPLFDDVDLANLAQSMASLKMVPQQDFMEDYLQEVLQKLPTFLPAVLTTLVTAISQFEHRPPKSWVQAVGDHATTRTWQYSGAHLASVVLGLSRLRYTATQKFLDDVVSASMAKLHKMNTSDFVCLIFGLANYKYQPSPKYREVFNSWFTEFQKLAGRRQYSCRQVCDLMHALACLGYSPSTEFLDSVLSKTRIYNLRNVSPERLARLPLSLQALGYRPDIGFLQNYAHAARFSWTWFKPADYACLLSGCIHTGNPSITDPSWACDFLTIIHCKLHEFDVASLTTTLNALWRLPKEFWPSQRWMATAVQRLSQLTPQLQPMEASSAICSLAKLGYRTAKHADAEPRAQFEQVVTAALLTNKALTVKNRPGVPAVALDNAKQLELNTALTEIGWVLHSESSRSPSLPISSSGHGPASSFTAASQGASHFNTSAAVVTHSPAAEPMLPVAPSTHAVGDASSSFEPDTAGGSVNKCSTGSASQSSSSSCITAVGNVNASINVITRSASISGHDGHAASAHCCHATKDALPSSLHESAAQHEQSTVAALADLHPVSSLSDVTKTDHMVLSSRQAADPVPV